METLIFLFLIIILVVLLTFRSTVIGKINEINSRMDQHASLLIKIKDLQSKIENIPSRQPTPKAFESPLERKAQAEEREEKPIIREEIKPAVTPALPAIKKEPEVVKVPEVIAPVAKPERKPVISEPPKPGFFERNPDLEKFIGENLANKIGIGILVLGIGFFVKYAIDQEWINVYGRVLIGILCGGILIGVAHRLRKTFIAFSSVLVGGGIAVLYLTIAIAFHEYEIIGQTPAFIIMVLITGFTVLLSIAYNRMELAILAILGGFASPFMVSRGEGNYMVLFSYVLVLNVGMLALAYFKKWNPVTIIAYIFTIILFGSWLSFSFDGENVPMIFRAFIFATLFYFTFFAMNIINNLKQRIPFKATEFVILLSNTFLYYSAGMYILNNAHAEEFRGLFTAFVGVFNFIFAFTLYKNSRVDRNLVFLLIGLVLTFISLAAPVQLEGNYITLFWAAEAVLLLWLSQKSGIILMKISAIVVMLLMWISLTMDWYNVYYVNLFREDYSLRIILNQGYITSMVSLVSISIFFYLLKFEKEQYTREVTIGKVVLTLVGGVILYTSQLLELTYHLNVYIPDYAARSVVIGCYNMIFIMAIILAERSLALPEKVKEGFGLWGVVAIFSYYLVYHTEIIATRYHFISGQYSSLGFVFHYLLVAVLVVIAAWSLNRFRTWKSFNEQTFNVYSWFFVFFFVFISSAELDHTVVLTSGVNAEDIYYVLQQNHKIGFPILWGIASFILIAVGLKKKRKHLRIISLTLLLITLLKLFLLDIRGISEGGKIAAFISLGILLLIVSFMYQRLKKILLTDETVIDTKEKEA